MKKELLIHLSTTFLFLIFITLVNQWFSVSFWPFWLGGVVGAFLPDIDHLIYVYLLKPEDLTSQRVTYLTQERSVMKAMDLLAETRHERIRLVFHTALFQVIFLVLTFFVVTSTGSLFAIGIVMSFSLHLVVDQLIDFRRIGSIQHWFKGIPVVLDRDKSRIYLAVMSFALLIFSIIL